ncbi:MAG: hypothetical protein LBP81_02955 [Treponema sp.]|nr:hypothetical protein [Treponema sp.]
MEGAIKQIDDEQLIQRAEAAPGKLRAMGIPEEPLALAGLLEIAGK